MTEYLSISRIIAAKKTAYENAFQYVETDEMDLGYFAIYHLNVLNEAFENLKTYIRRKTEEQKAAKKFLNIGNLNLRQAEIVQLYCEDPNANIMRNLKKYTPRVMLHMGIIMIIFFQGKKS